MIGKYRIEHVYYEFSENLTLKLLFIECIFRSEFLGFINDKKLHQFN